MPRFEETIACQDRDFPEWHGGRHHALVWALELDAPGLQHVVDAARTRLDGLLLPRYDRQPHVTVAFAGLGAQPGLPGYDDLRLAQDLASLKPLVRGSVELRPTGWGSFPMVPYLGVGSQWLVDAHRVLDRGAGEAHGMGYVPHVTLGHWCGRWPRRAVLDRLEAPLPTHTWRVGALSLMRYETHDIAGELEPVGRLDLSGGVWTPASPH